MNHENFKSSAPGICFLLEDFYPVIHGAAVQTQLLGQRLVQRGVPVTVITRQIQKSHPAKDHLDGISIYRVKPVVGLHRLGKYLMMGPALLELIKRRKTYEFIIVCDLKVLGILGVIVAKLLGKKCLLNAVSCGEFDGSFVTQYQKDMSSWQRGLAKLLVDLRNKLLLSAQGFISISSAITKEFVDMGIPRESVFEIHYGVDVVKAAPISEEEKMRLRTKLGFLGKHYFVYTGRVVHGKGLEYLIEVWKELTTKFQDIHLIFVGAGQGFSLSCEDELKDFVKKHSLESSVVFTGGVKNVYDYLRIADNFVFPSQSEGLGLSLIEALAFGLPSIATNVGGILDIIRNDENGTLVKYGDVQGLYKAMERCLTDSKSMRRLGQEGRKTVLEKFNLDIIADRYVTLMHQLAAS